MNLILVNFYAEFFLLLLQTVAYLLKKNFLNVLGSVVSVRPVDLSKRIILYC